MIKRVYFSGWIQVPDHITETYGVGLGLLDMLIDHGVDFLDTIAYDYEVTHVQEIEDTQEDV